MIDGQFSLFDDEQDLRLSTAETDKIFMCGSGFEDGKQRIYKQIIKREGPKENAAFLKKEYGVGGWSLELEGRAPMFLNHDGRGIEIECWKEGKTKRFSWEDVAKRIQYLVFTGEYMKGAWIEW